MIPSSLRKFYQINCFVKVLAGVLGHILFVNISDPFQLNLNPIKDPGVEAILKAAEKHPRLSLLSIEVCCEIYL